jgi:hypothetical protein
MRVRGRIGRVVVRSQVSFDFNDPSCQYAVVRPMRENLAQQAWGDVLRGRFKEGAGQQSAWHSGEASQDLSLMKMAG